MNWFKKIFQKCDHNLIFTTKPIRLKRWVENDSNPFWLSEIEAMENGHWEYSEGKETSWYCTKCGYYDWKTE